MSKQLAHQQAIDAAANALSEVDLTHRCPNLGLAVPDNGKLAVRFLGTEVSIDTGDFSAVAKSGEAVRPEEHILILHYLLCDVPVPLSSEPIAFRQLKGAPFYEGPFRARTVEWVAKAIGNNLDRLRANLDTLGATPLQRGDLSTRVPAIGNLWLDVVYSLGDDEFPPAAEILFSENCTRVYNAEDAVVLASRLCSRMV